MAQEMFPPQRILSPKAIPFKLATWNIQGGLHSDEDSALLFSDLQNLQVDVACLQETHRSDVTILDPANTGNAIHFIDSDNTTPAHQRYGQGFYISAKWRPYLHSLKRVSNRISVINFNINRTKSKLVRITIINVYAPTSIIVQQDPDQAMTFYQQLSATLHAHRRSFITLIAGDFNSKLGVRTDPHETFMGNYGKGTRNRNGHLLANFISEHNYFASNTAFKHRLSSRTTWIGRTKLRQDQLIPNHPTTRLIHNQIDYILVPLQHIHQPTFLMNARSHTKTTYPSDHKLVLTTMLLKAVFFRRPRHKQQPKRSFDASKLSASPELQATYQEELTKTLEPANHPMYSHPEVIYEHVTASMLSIANSLIPKEPDPLHRKVNSLNDPQLKQWSIDRADLLRRLRRRRYNPPHIRQRYNRLSRIIRFRSRQLHNKKLQYIASELEKNKGNKRCFEAQRLLRRCTRTPFSLSTPDGQHITNPLYQLPLIDNFYKEFFNQADLQQPAPWVGNPRPLTMPITVIEVQRATSKLNNGRAAGPDSIPGEFYKYGGPALHSSLADMFNDMFIYHEPIPALCAGLLIPLNKSNTKPKFPANTRPITLLNSARKVLSNIVLARISPKVQQYISINQSGFRQHRSTSDIIWTYRFLMAITQKYQQEFFIMGIDLSKAFDCINRQLVLTHLRDLIDESEYRIITYLLSDTTLQTRIQGVLSTPFSTSIGTPQGDALSPILFIIYLEAALRYHKSSLPSAYSANIFIPQYADDTDFISTDYADHLITSLYLPANLQTFNLTMNPDKTEHTTLSKATCPNLTTTKLGNKLGPPADIKYHISQANHAFSTLWKLWLNKRHITRPTKLRLYNACIKPILTYNLSSLPASDHQISPLDAAHRRHLRSIMPIHYPDTISNADLYHHTKQEPIALDILKSRLSLFGHILRSDPDTPANTAMLQFFDNPTKALPHRGRPPTTLPSLLHHDLLLVNKHLKTSQDFQKIKDLARNRRLWKALSIDILHNKRDRLKEDLARTAATRKRRRDATPTNSNSIVIEYSDTNGIPKRLRLLLQEPDRPLILRLRLRRPREDDPEAEEDAYGRRVRRSVESAATFL